MFFILFVVCEKTTKLLNVPNRAYHYKKDLTNFNLDGLKFPLPVKQISKFEKQNSEFSVNVYALDEVKNKSRENKVNLYPSLHFTT